MLCVDFFRLADAIGKVGRTLDFSIAVEDKGRDEIAMAANGFNVMISSVKEAISLAKNKATDAKVGADELCSAAKEMLDASVVQSTSASSMAATMEEMTVSINHVADKALEADDIVRKSGQLALEGARIVKKSIDSIYRVALTVDKASSHVDMLRESSQKVNSIIAIIKEVADQTNLLALNASIEAARAGEQGRGFAVVADEVRKLAERTAKSTQDISETIEKMTEGAQLAIVNIASISSVTSETVIYAQDAINSIDEISRSSDEAIFFVSEIASSIKQQSGASNLLAQEVERIAQMSEEISAIAKNSSDGANHVGEETAEILRAASKFTL